MTARSLTAEVVALTGVPRATIHSYLRRGLLPRPRRASPARFAYDERHVRALQLIRSLRESRHPRRVLAYWLIGLGLLVVLTVLGVKLPNEGG